MARKRTAVSPWISLGGSSRRYLNPVTGETISRERYEREHGSLKARGAVSFKRATAAVPEDLRRSRPARGRGSQGRRMGEGAIQGLRPLTGRISRDVDVAFYAFYEGDVSVFMDEAEQYREEFDTAKVYIEANRAFESVNLSVKYENRVRGTSGFYTIIRNEHVPSFLLYNYNDVVELIAEKAYPGDEVGPITLHFVFLKQYWRQKKKRVRGVKIPKGYRPKPNYEA